MIALDRAVIDAIAKGASTSTAIRAATGARATDIAESVRRLRWQGRVRFDKLALNSSTIEPSNTGPASLAPTADVPTLATSLPAPVDCPPEPIATPVSAGISLASRTPFRSWAEDYVPDKGWKYDGAAVRAAKAIRTLSRSQRDRAQNGKPRNHRDNLAVQQKAIHDAASHRLTDPFERAKAFLQRRVPVYAAKIVPDRPASDAHKYVVGSKLVTRGQLIEMARAKGWVE